MKKKTCVFILLILAVVSIIPLSVYANAQNDTRPVFVNIDGRFVDFQDQRPIVVEDTILVPVRGVFEHMGFEIQWDPINRMARLERDDVTIVIPADMNAFVVNNAVVTPEVPQQIVGERLMLPLRAVAEAAGGVVTWDDTNRVARIVTAAVATPTPAPPTP